MNFSPAFKELIIEEENLENIYNIYNEANIRGVGQYIDYIMGHNKMELIM